jgi:hypothetical protein
MRETAATFRELIRLAKAGGAEARWLTSAAGELVELLLDLEDLRRAADPRKVKTFALARRVADADAALRAAGVTNRRVSTLCIRFGLGRSQVHRLLRLSHDSRDSYVVDSADELPKRI